MYKRAASSAARVSAEVFGSSLASLCLLAAGDRSLDVCGLPPKSAFISYAVKGRTLLKNLDLNKYCIRR